jgi:rhodanese-related sulfurtransferase
VGPPFPAAVADGIRLGLYCRGRVAEHPVGCRYARGVPSDYTAQEVAALLAAAEIQLIDVRQPEEWAAGRIAGARHVELAQLAAQAETIDRDRPVVFYCRSGGRSAMATEAFAGAGFDAHNMAGGLLDWAATGLPLDPEDGTVAEH